MDSTKVGIMIHNASESSFENDVKAKQRLDPTLVELKEVMLKKSVEVLSQGGDDVLRCQGHFCVLNVDELTEHILVESHSSRYSIHSRTIKMYRSLREVHWWNGMKKDIVGFVSKSPNFR